MTATTYKRWDRTAGAARFLIVYRVTVDHVDWRQDSPTNLSPSTASLIPLEIYLLLRLQSLLKTFLCRDLLLSFQLVYLQDALGNGKVVKREYPQRFVLTYSHVLEYPQQAFSHE